MTTSKRGRFRKKSNVRGVSFDDVIHSAMAVIHGESDPKWAALSEPIRDLRGIIVHDSRRKKRLPLESGIELFDILAEDASEEAITLRAQQKRQILRLVTYCDACQGWDETHCAALPDVPLEKTLRRQIFCRSYHPAEGCGNAPSHKEMDFNFHLPVLIFLMIVVVIFLILATLVRLVFIPFKWLWRGMWFVVKWIAGGFWGGFLGLKSQAFRLGAWIRSVHDRTRQILDAVRGAMGEPQPLARDASDDAELQAVHLAEELNEVRLEAERVRAELKERDRTELKDREGLLNTMEARITELEERLSADQTELIKVSKRARVLGRLVRQQQEIIDGKARSARRLATSKRRLGRRLEEAANLIPEDVLVASKDADQINAFLEAAEAELEERDAELSNTRDDFDDALDELETYEQQLAIAEQHISELEKERAGRSRVEKFNKATSQLPRRIADTEIVTARRFAKEFDALSPSLQPFVSARLRLLVEQPDRLERRTYLVGEADRAAYSLPKREGLRKCRVNVKYRMFIVARGQAIELVSVAKHA